MSKIGKATGKTIGAFFLSMFTYSVIPSSWADSVDSVVSFSVNLVLDGFDFVLDEADPYIESAAEEYPEIAAVISELYAVEEEYDAEGYVEDAPLLYTDWLASHGTYSFTDENGLEIVTIFNQHSSNDCVIIAYNSENEIDSSNMTAYPFSIYNVTNDASSFDLNSLKSSWEFARAYINSAAEYINIERPPQYSSLTEFTIEAPGFCYEQSLSQ